MRAAGVAISTPVSAGYGFEEATRDVQLQFSGDNAQGVTRTEPDTVTLMLAETAETEATIHLLDAVTGAELTRLGPVELAISL